MGEEMTRLGREEKRGGGKEHGAGEEMGRGKGRRVKDVDGGG